jgi:hypothetical protein
MDYRTVRQTAEKWNCNIRQIQDYLKAERIPGAVQPGREWMIPKDAVKPPDGRRKENKNPERKAKNRAETAQA